MRTLSCVFILLFSISIYAGEFKTPEEVRREFHEPGHIPQGLKPRHYRKLDDLIPPERRKVLSEEKRQRRLKKKESTPKPTSWFSLFPSAYAACVTPQVIPDPTPSPTDKEESTLKPPPEPLTPVPTPLPTQLSTSPLPVPSVSSSVSPSPIVSPAPSETPEPPVPAPTPLPTQTVPSPLPSPVVLPSPSPLPVSLKIDLRPFDSYIRNQWGSTCTAHAVAAIMENRLKQTGVTGTLSVRYLWNQYQALNTLKALQAAYSDPLEVDETLWPEANPSPVAALLSLSSQGKYRITGYSYISAVYTPAVKAELLANRPVYIALSVPSDLGSCRATVRITSLMTSGAHAMAVVGMVEDDTLVKEGQGYLILKNSWGTGCGEKGYHYLPFSFCDRDDVFCEFYRVTAVK